MIALMKLIMMIAIAHKANAFNEGDDKPGELDRRYVL